MSSKEKKALFILMISYLTVACQPQNEFLAVNDSPSDISDFRRSHNEDLERIEVSPGSDVESKSSNSRLDSSAASEDESVSISTMISGSYLTSCIKASDEVVCGLKPEALKIAKNKEKEDLKIAIIVTDRNSYRKVNYRVKHERVDQTWELKVEPQNPGLSLNSWTSCDRNCNWKSEIGEYDILLKISSSHYENGPLSIVLAHDIKSLLL